MQRYLHRTLDPDHQVNSEQQLSLIPDEDENTARDVDTRDMVKARAIIDLADALEEHLDIARPEVAAAPTWNCR